MQEEKKKAPSSQAPLQDTPLRDITEKDEAWENTLSQTDRLALAYLRLEPFKGWWDETILGPRPKYLSHRYMEAIADVVGRTEISRFEAMEINGWTYDQWVRWYTVERVQEQQAEEQRHREARWKEDRRHLIIACLAIPIVIGIIVPLGLLAIKKLLFGL